MVNEVLKVFITAPYYIDVSDLEYIHDLLSCDSIEVFYDEGVSANDSVDRCDVVILVSDEVSSVINRKDNLYNELIKANVLGKRVLLINCLNDLVLCDVDMEMTCDNIFYNSALNGIGLDSFKLQYNSITRSKFMHYLSSLIPLN